MITENQSTKIELLPEHIIDQIKAGEVLERPASLIKELIENSIDASSNEIDLHIVDNGMELISLEDNGNGMSFENLPMAFLRHATSKIKTFDDIYRLHSYGFRGEALASIAASARVTCQTQPKDLNINGGKIVINGGLEELLVPMKNTKKGTAFYIKNLFYNTPARLKFVKSKNSERIQLKKMITSFLLSHPEIKFSIKWDDKEKEVYKAFENQNYIERIKDVIYPKRKEESPILYAKNEYDKHSVEVYFTLQPLKNSPNKIQFLFANDRLFFDKNLHQAIIRTTDSIWKYGESGHYVIFINTPPEEIDVNIHPNKTQVKFSKSDIVYSLLVNTLKDAIKKFNKTETSPLASISMPEMEVQSFFSQDEIESQSLNYLKDQTFKAEALPSVSTINPHHENSFDFVNLTKRYFLFKNQETHFLANKVQLFTQYLKKIYKECEEKDENTSPLLISEPFNIDESIDVCFPQMKKYGHEFDRLNQTTIVLRTIPRRMHREFIKISAEVLILNAKSNKKFSLDGIKITSPELVSKIENINTVLFLNLFTDKTILLELSKKITDNLLEKMLDE